MSATSKLRKMDGIARNKLIDEICERAFDIAIRSHLVNDLKWTDEEVNQFRNIARSAIRVKVS